MTMVRLHLKETMTLRNVLIDPILTLLLGKHEKEILKSVLIIPLFYPVVGTGFSKSGQENLY